MNFDCIIIGAGISGLTCGIRCAEKGLTCAIISSGMNALHFSSGSIDLLGFYPGKDIVHSPYTILETFIASNPGHPYAKYGTDLIRQSLSYFEKQITRQGIHLHANGDNNHFHVTSLGTLKPSFLSQASVFNHEIKKAFKEKPNIAFINIDGFRDFNPKLIADNLKGHPLFNTCEINTGSINLNDSFSELKSVYDNAYNLRSIDISRIFDAEKNFELIADRLLETAGQSTFAGMPAVFGIKNVNRVLSKLYDMTGLFIYEIPTLPPSILGMRLDNALKSRFTELGGVFIAGDRVKKGVMKNNRVDHICTQNSSDVLLSAECYVLSTGSFFSGGMTSDSNGIKEPIFDLAIDYTKSRKTWYSSDFFQAESHPFLNFGVKTEKTLNPFDNKGRQIENLFCTGAILSNYDPIKEGSGGGVAISSGYYAAEQIIQNKKT